MKSTFEMINVGFLLEQLWNCLLLMFSRASFPMSDEILESAEDVWALLAPIIATSNWV